MENNENSIVREGKELTVESNIPSFAKRFKEGDYPQDSLKKIFKHHYAKGTYDVFDRLRDEIRKVEGLEEPMMAPPAPRGQWYNVIRTPNGRDSILIGDIIYTKEKNKNWTYKGGKKTRKHRKARKTRTKKY